MAERREMVEMALESLIEKLKGIEGVADAVVDDSDHDGWATIVIYPQDPLEDQRKISAAIRKTIRKRGHGVTIDSFSGVEKRRDRWGDTEILQGTYVIDPNLYSVELHPIDLGESAVFDNVYDGFGAENDKAPLFVEVERSGSKEAREALKEVFFDTYPKAQNPWNHAEIMESDSRLKDYHVSPLWLYRHGPGCEKYELEPSCRWDSSMIGCIAIRRDSDLEPAEILNNLNAVLYEYLYGEPDDCYDEVA